MTDFDTIASEYDAQFSSSKIGIKQRQRVWKYLLRHTFSEQRVLELNCGTGIDAQFLGKRCLSVHATDLSTEMIATAKSRNSQDNVSFQKLGIQYLSEVNNEYDLIFSNFGGLNCISPEEWSIAAKEIHRLLSKNGSFIAVIMSRKCLWERFYFRLKKDSKNQRRRVSKHAIMANIGNQKVATWYYEPGELQHFLENKFNHVRSQPIGLFLPPSYLESFFAKNNRMLNVLSFLESFSLSSKWLANRADHYLIHFKKQQQ